MTFYRQINVVLSIWNGNLSFDFGLSLLNVNGFVKPFGKDPWEVIDFEYGYIDYILKCEMVYEVHFELM